MNHRDEGSLWCSHLHRGNNGRFYWTDTHDFRYNIYYYNELHYEILILKMCKDSVLKNDKTLIFLFNFFCVFKCLLALRSNEINNLKKNYVSEFKMSEHSYKFHILMQTLRR